MGSYHGIVSWIRIMGSYHGFVSWVRILGSFHGFVSWAHIMVSHVFAAWVRIMALYNGFVSWIRFMGPYHGFVFCIKDAFRGFVSWACLATVFTITTVTVRVFYQDIFSIHLANRDKSEGGGGKQARNFCWSHSQSIRGAIGNAIPKRADKSASFVLKTVQDRKHHILPASKNPTHIVDSRVFFGIGSQSFVDSSVSFGIGGQSCIDRSVSNSQREP